MSQTCQRCAELFREVQTVLDELTALTRAQAEAFSSQNMQEFARIDKALENTVGRKERCIGAHREHRREHGLSS